MRPASKDDFVVSVEGIGDFTFGQRKMSDHTRILVEYSRITEGVAPTPLLDAIAGWIAPIRVLAVRVPAGFDLEELDPLEEATYDKLMRINSALSAKERSFRGKPNATSEGSGATAI